MRKIALVGFDNLLGKCLELVLKSILNESASICPVTEEKIRKDYAYNLIILHSDKATSDSSVISLVRKLRKNKCLTPIITFVFSDKNMHRVFSEKAHVLLTYPFMIDNLKKILLHIKQLNPGDIDFIQERFYDEKYRETLSGAIMHAVSHKDWGKVESELTEFEKCFGRNKSLTNLLTERIETKSDWENLLKNTKKGN